MGRSYRYDCDRCTYTARICGAEIKDTEFVVDTIVCRDCRELYDVISSIKLKPATAQQIRNNPFQPKLTLSADRLTELETKLEMPANTLVKFRRLNLELKNRSLSSVSLSQEWFPMKLRCPKSHLHKTQRWHDPGRCPKCQTYLDRSPLPFRMWD